MDKIDVENLIEEYLQGNLSVTVNCSKENAYGGGDYVNVEVIIKLGDKIVSQGYDSFNL